MGRTRQSYYERLWHQKVTSDAGAETLALVQRIRRQMPRIGTRKLYHLLHAEFEARHLHVGRDTLFRLLRNALPVGDDTRERPTHGIGCANTVIW
jgi:hypothetical protein